MAPPDTRETPAGETPARRRRPSPVVLNILTALVGVVTLAAGIGWVVYDWLVNLSVSYFAIPLVMTVPVIVAVAFRCCWD